MKLRYTCDCGHENLWSVFEGKISNFICDGCGDFIGAYGNDLKFAGEKGVGIYKKYDPIAEELVLMRGTDNHQHCGFVPQVTWAYNYSLNTIDDTTDYYPISFETTSHTHNGPISVTYHWSQV